MKLKQKWSLPCASDILRSEDVHIQVWFIQRYVTMKHTSMDHAPSCFRENSQSPTTSTGEFMSAVQTPPLPRVRGVARMIARLTRQSRPRLSRAERSSGAAGEITTGEITSSSKRPLLLMVQKSTRRAIGYSVDLRRASGNRAGATNYRNANSGATWCGSASPSAHYCRRPSAAFHLLWRPS